MCDKSENIETEQQEQEITMEELMNSMGLQPLELDITNLDGIQYDKKEFAKGIKEMSLIAGQITALLNVGLTSAQAIDFLINAETIKHNIGLAIENNKTTLEASKNQIIQMEKQQL